MKLSQTQKLILALVLFGISGFVIYSSFFAPAAVTDNMSDSGTASSTASAENQSVINMVSEINAVSIDPQVFSSPLFTNLNDFDVPPTPEPQGRPNPFADIGVNSSASTQNIAGTIATSSNSSKK
jgi:hypothetical protein